MTISKDLIDVLLPVPVMKKFSYKLSKEYLHQKLEPGIRVKVPFGNRTLIGVFWQYSDTSTPKQKRYKYIKEVLDKKPLIDQQMLALADWSSRYYHYPLGQVLTYFFPTSLRKGKEAKFKETSFWNVTRQGALYDLSSLNRAPKQKKALEFLREKGESSQVSTKAYGISVATLSALGGKGLVSKLIKERLPIHPLLKKEKVQKKLTSDQAKSTKEISERKDSNDIFLLNGITGSGKTEVYLRSIREVVQSGMQALVLIPEIGLTPQVERRFKVLFGERVASFHSAKNERERLDVWLGSAKGLYDVVIGTRSSVFIPMKNLGMIIVDEEHDTSFKQTDRFRYSARDIALYRAKITKIPVVLASASPSIESLNNALKGKYKLLTLKKRATGANLPEFFPLDLKGKEIQEGFSEFLTNSIGWELANKNQVLIFINRRGYASSLICKSCGWVSGCSRCDAHMTVHVAPGELQCHHCGHKRNLPNNCPSCRESRFESFGVGTEKVEGFLKKKFKGIPVIRVDSDSTRPRGSFKKYLEIIKKGDPLILVGTQLLAKGHHFPDVTLVGILDADSGIFSADFRGSERVAQLITQVSGRAGREKKPGKVILQTYCPDHPLIEELLEGSYEKFAIKLIAERFSSKSPPFSYQVKLHAESENGLLSRNFLNSCLDFLSQSKSVFEGVRVVGPLPSLMEKKSGVYRWEVNLFSTNRKPLHRLIDHLQVFLYQPKLSRKVRWAIDVDPVSTI